MSATKLQANWTSVEFATYPITMVTSLMIDNGGDVQTFKADTDLYDVVAAQLTKRPTVSITGGDVATLMGLSGTGVLTATHNDALKATGGAVVYTITTAVWMNTKTSGDHGEFGTATADFKTVTSDGMTNPIAMTRT